MFGGCRRYTVVLVLVLYASHALAEVSLEPRAVELVRGDADLSSGPPEGWTHIAMTADPKLVRGNPASVPKMVLRYLEAFGSVILARVEPVMVGEGPTAEKQYRLRKIGVAHTAPTSSGRRIIDSSSESLDFIGGRVLASGEKELAKLRQIASYETALVFDTPAVMVRNERHTALTIRNFVWTSAKRGGLATAMWAIETTDAGPRVADNRFVWVPAGFKSQRSLSVDPSQFTLGMPGPKAFAMVGLPAGEKVGFSTELAQVAAAPQFTKQSLQRLAAGLATAISKKTTAKNTAAHAEKKPAAAGVGR